MLKPDRSVLVVLSFGGREPQSFQHYILMVDRTYCIPSLTSIIVARRPVLVLVASNIMLDSYTYVQIISTNWNEFSFSPIRARPRDDLHGGTTSEHVTSSVVRAAYLEWSYNPQPSSSRFSFKSRTNTSPRVNPTRLLVRRVFLGFPLDLPSRTFVLRSKRIEVALEGFRRSPMQPACEASILA